VTNYRAQFPFLTPAGYRDEPYQYFFDNTSTPSLSLNLAVGQIIDVPLQIEPGPEFRWRGVTITPPGGIVVGVQFLDPVGNQLSNDFQPAQFFQALNPDAVTIGGKPGEVLEPEVSCPGGSVIIMRVQRLA